MAADRILRPFDTLRSLLAAVLTGLLLATAAHGAPGGAQGTLSITVTVTRHTSMRLAPPAAMTVTPEDAARGYVEVQAPLELLVQSNVQQGYTLVFERLGEHVRQARVQAPDGEFLVGENGALRSRPAPGRGTWKELLLLHLRFELAPGTAPGQYPWPLQISMMSA